MTTAQAIKKLEIAIDKLIAVKDGGFNCDDVERSLENINHVITKLENQ